MVQRSHLWILETQQPCDLGWNPAIPRVPRQSPATPDVPERSAIIPGVPCQLAQALLSQ